MNEERLKLKKAARRECKRAKTVLQALLDYAAINGHLLDRAENVIHAIDYFMAEVTIEIADHERGLEHEHESELHIENRGRQKSANNT